MAGAFKVVEEKPADADLPAGSAVKDKSAATEMLLLALGALSKRAVIALSSLFTVASVASAFWLWMGILPSPSINQLVGVSLYAVFVLAIEYIRRRD